MRLFAGIMKEDSRTHQAFDVIEQLINLLAACQADVTFSEETPDLSLDLIFVHIHHDKESHHVIQHYSKQTIFVVL